MNETKLWLLTLLSFGIGDSVTTIIGLSIGVVEFNPLIDNLLSVYGVTSIIGMKILFFVFAYVMSVKLPEKHQAGVSMGLFVVMLFGAVVTITNLAAIGVNVL